MDRQILDVESSGNIDQKLIDKNRFIPPVDFSSASNFAKYGSAEEYYDSSIKRIYKQYPYDGSEREIQEFLNDSTYLDLYVLDNLYPRSTGYAIFSPNKHGGGGWSDLVGSIIDGYGQPTTKEYIQVRGGPHTASAGASGKPLHQFFGDPAHRTSPNSNIYDSNIYDTAGVKPLGRVGTQESNLKLDLNKGTTIEFWMKKDQFLPASTQKEVIFDLWNGESSGSALKSHNPSYGRLTVELSASAHHPDAGANPLYVTLQSGSRGFYRQSIGKSSFTTASVADNSWHHYAISMLSASAGTDIKFYVDGELNNHLAGVGSFGVNEITGSLVANIGALRTEPSGTSAAIAQGWGKLSASLDDFRYWKTKRTSKEIGRNWWTQVRGGTNNDVSNAELGFYYKFNEGITNTASLDQVVLDYSGRISNGYWTGYSSQSRNTGSAMVSASVAPTEFEDPIIYSQNPKVKALSSVLKQSGSWHDERNNAALYYSLPSYVIDEASGEGQNDLLYLTQIIGSYFDSLHLQIEAVKDLKNVHYDSASYKPLPFSSRLLSSHGLYSPEIFADADILATFANRDEDRDFKLKLHNVKNRIYQNIYNNLIYIYKSKGSEKSFRNLIRCFGVDDELININLYSNNSTYELSENYKSKAAKKRCISFNHFRHNRATVYQQSASSDANLNTKDVTFISGSDRYLATTAEAEILFPKVPENKTEDVYVTTFQSSSLFGCHLPAQQASNFSWQKEHSDHNFQVYAVRPSLDEIGKNDAYFLIKDRSGKFNLTSSVFKDVYDNQKWNFAVRFKDDKFPNSDKVSGSKGDTGGVDIDTVKMEFYGVNASLDVIQNQFMVTASGLNLSHITSSRRYYAGAHRQDFTGTLQSRSDVELCSIRHWASYLDNGAINAHAKDAEAYGPSNPYKSSYLLQTDLEGTWVPQIETLALHWNFANVTGTDAKGSFEITDFSSGSAGLRTRYSDTFGHIVGNQYSGRGVNFIPNSTASVSVNYIASARQQLPEVLNSDNMVTAHPNSRDDITFTRETRPVNYFFAFEKSMYRAISEEMINMFGSIVEFNNLIGNPVNRYRGEYKEMTKLRQLFFEKVGNTPNLDKFVSYYKWIDNSLSVMLQQLVPASSDMSENIRTMVESHALERNKYRSKLPRISKKIPDYEARVKGIQEMLYPWQQGHAPLPSVGATVATATITIAVATVDVVGEGDVISLVSTDGTTITCTLQGVGGTTTSSTTDGNVTAATFASSTDNTLQATAQAVAIRTAINNNNFFTATNDANVVTVTQAVPGVTGNTVITIAELGSAGMSKTDFVNGTDKPSQSQNCFWWNQRAERHGADLTSGNNTIDVQKETFRKQYISHISSSAPILVGTPTDASAKYSSSEYPIRRFTKLYNLAIEVGMRRAEEIHGGMNRPFNDNPMYYRHLMKFNDSSGLVIKNILAEGCEEETAGLPDWRKKIRKRYTVDGEFNERLSPFVIFKTSVSTGYNAKLKNDFLDGVDIVGLHDDDYPIIGGNFTPMQGPFTERFVGGMPHRHVDINRYSAGKTGANGLDGDKDRPEPFKMTLADGQITISHPDAEKPRSMHYRDEMVKRPVNIRNIKFPSTSPTKTVSGTLRSEIGNYRKDYEVVQAVGGRSTNNRHFVRQGGLASTSSASPFLSGVVDYTKPSRERTEHVIVNRFSAPGGPEVAGDNNGGAGLDFEAAEYSPYNSLNYRNLTVRTPLREMLTSHTNRFGYRSGSSESTASYSGVTSRPNFHQINRNRIKTLKLSSNGVLRNARTSSQHDNYWVQHPIPRSDLQYSWISSSYTSSRILGHAHPDGNYERSSSVRPIDFMKKSEVALSSFKKGGVAITKPVGINAPDLFVDFAGMNTLIREPLSSSDSRVGWPSEDNSSADGLAVERYRNSKIASISQADLLNATILHRGGIYGYGGWTSIRGDRKPLVRHWRKNSLQAVTTDAKDAIVIDAPSHRVLKGEDVTKVFTEPAVASSEFPLEYSFGVASGSSGSSKPATVRAAFGNVKNKFGNIELNTALYLEDSSADTYNTLKDIYTSDIENSPIQDFVSLKYKQVVYPQVRNAYQKRTRKRNSYENNFWRSNRSDRNKLGGTKFDGINKGLYSSWNMDADTDFATVISGATAGILQNNFTHFHHLHSDRRNMTASILLHLKHQIPGTASVVNPAYGRLHVTGNTATTPGVLAHTLGFTNIGGGNALWEAGAQAGYVNEKGNFISASSSPWYDSYDDYAKDLLPINKDYSIIPEFRISDHIDYYMKDRQGNFLAENSKLFSIEGQLSGTAATVNSVSHPQNSSEDKFYEIYSNSDFLRQFEVLREDHRDFVDPTSITLTCKAIKKFIPYNGFYPAELLADMWQQFSSSYMDNVHFYHGGDSDAQKQGVRARTFYTPMFAPGIWCNTIKSGIAVDFPIFTGSWKEQRVKKMHGGTFQNTNYFLISGSKDPHHGADRGYDGWDFRVPFEATVEPERYLSNKLIYDMHPGDDIRLDSTASWDGSGDNLYKMKAHNALNSMISFFLPGEEEGELSTLISGDENQFGDFVKGQTYGMRVKLRKSYNGPRQRNTFRTRGYTVPQDLQGDIDAGLEETITLCSRPSSFGPPVSGRRFLDHTASAYLNVDAVRIQDSLQGHNPAFTPPYYNGEAWADVLYTHTLNSQPTVTQIQSGSKVICWRYDEQPLEQRGSNATPYGHDNVNIFSMQLTHSVNILGKAEINSVEFDPLGGAKSIKSEPSTTSNVWVIQPKFETPILNFHTASAMHPTIPTFGSESVTRGIWSQFGRIPKDPSVGLFMEVADIDESWLTKRLPNFKSLHAAHAGIQVGSTLARDYKWVLSTYNTGSGKIQSLADNINFSKRSVKLGQIAKKRKFKEAVVAIPFVEIDDKKNFFEIPYLSIKSTIDFVQGKTSEKPDIGESIVDMITKMNDYVFPPTFDFLTDSSVDPIAMYIFEFEHSFGQDDLSYIWQNLKPLSAETVETAQATISHDLLTDELMGYTAGFADNPLQENLKWMVFKVKQRSGYNYFDKLSDADSRYSFDFSIGRASTGESLFANYSYNWPYDYFSMIESVKMEAEVEFSTDTDKEKEVQTPRRRLNKNSISINRTGPSSGIGAGRERDE